LPCWIWLLLLVLVALLLFLLLRRKKKFVVDWEFVKYLKDKKELDNIDKFKTVFVTEETYSKILESEIDSKRFIVVILNDKGKEYFKKCNDKDVSLAKQLKAYLITLNKDKIKIAKANNVEIYELK